MKDGAHATKRDANTGPASFPDLGAKRFKKRLNVTPWHVSPDRIGENSPQG
jgi:hypothetical protein